jgi:hypothetical protein
MFRFDRRRWDAIPGKGRQAIVREAQTPGMQFSIAQLDAFLAGEASTQLLGEIASRLRTRRD